MTAETNPAYEKPRMQPLVALRALRELIADPEKTDRVFVIVKAMSGNSFEKSFKRFRRTAMGQRILQEKRELVEVLKDRESLRALPAGSLGRAYLEFVESENISAEGLVDASGVDREYMDDEHKLFGERLRDQHDLWHTVTGYGRDTFGEACLLAFTYAQTRNRGLGIITLAGMFKISQELGPEVKKAVWQGYKAGKRAAWLPEQDWETLVARPIEEVRQQLDINPPVKYREVFEQYALAH